MTEELEITDDQNEQAEAPKRHALVVRGFVSRIVYDPQNYPDPVFTAIESDAAEVGQRWTGIEFVHAVIRRHAQVRDGVVVNVCPAPDGFDAGDGSEFVASDVAQTGDEYENGEFTTPPPEPERVPDVISDRQFFHALWKEGHISFAEALAAVRTGELPAALDTFVSSLPEEQEQDARMFLQGVNTFERSHPLTPFVAAGMGWTSEQTDTIWRRGKTL